MKPWTFLQKILSGTPDHGSGQFDTFHIFSSTGYVSQECRIRGGGAIVPQVFGRSVNPIWTRGGQILPTILLLAPLRFLEDAGSLISGLLKANSPLFVLHVNFIRRIFSQQYSVMTIWPHTVWFISILRELRMNKCA